MKPVQVIKPLLSIVILCFALMNFGNAMWISAKARLAQHLIESSWEDTLASGEANPPWQWADTWPIARLKHEASDTDLFVLEGADGSTLAFGPGHMSGTDMPGVDTPELGASVIGGHRDTHFNFLKEVQLEDELLVQNRSGEWQRFQVDHIHTVNSEETPLTLPVNENRLILITCYPFDNWIPGGPMRYIVEASLVT